VGVGIFQVLGTALAARHQTGRRSLDLLAVVLLAIGPIALVVRRRYPITVLVVCISTVLAYWVIGYPRGPVFLAMIAALGTVVLAGHHRVAAASLVIGGASFLWLGAAVHRDTAPSFGAVVGLAAWLLVLFGAAEWIRIRTERARDAARLRDEETRRRVSDERLAIARELHDVVAHNISLINVQAATTLHLLDDGEARAVAALSTIKRVSQEVLVELRSVLGVLRGVDESAPRAPAPTLSRVDELVAQANETGVAAHIDVEGTPRSLPAPVDLAAYRVVQEALTNVARHAGTAEAAVRVVYHGADLVVQVDDDGRTPAVVTPGNGITGMRERVGALGGTLQAAPRPSGGFRVRAWFPLEDGA
jgi:signal transduction histidine kinase